MYVWGYVCDVWMNVFVDVCTPYVIYYLSIRDLRYSPSRSNLDSRRINQSIYDIVDYLVFTFIRKARIYLSI